MRAALPLLLLLLFLLDGCGAATVVMQNAINWEECGQTALCRIHQKCIVEGSQSKDLFDPAALPVKKCHLGIHIKPQTVHKWTVSIVNEEQTDKNKKTTWQLKEEVVTCTGNTPTLGTIPGVSMPSITPQSTGYTLCVFTLETANDKIYKYFNDIREDNYKSSLIIESSNVLSLNVEYLRLKDLIACTKDHLYNSLHCSDLEDCLDPEKIGTEVECQEGYTSLFRKDDSSNFTKAEIRCTEGEFQYKEPSTPERTTSFDKITRGESAAKCARRKCSLCTPREQFKGLLVEQHDCHKLVCSGNATFMVIATTDAKTLTSTEPLQCSDKTNVPTDTYKDYPEKDARWIVNDEDEVDIKSIECKERISCDLEGMQLVTVCDKAEKKEHTCIKADRDATGAYLCKEGYTMHAIVNNSAVSIDAPVCEDKGTWSINSRSDNASLATDASIAELNIKCYLNAVPRKATPSESGYTWIIVLVFLIVLILVLLGVGIYCFLKRKKGAKTTVSTPAKTSTASKTSSKPSSSEKEPLTSAMVSLTGDSVQTAKPRTPVKLAKADIRAMTAAASDPSTNKEEKKVDKKEKKDKLKSDQVEKTCEQSDRKEEEKKDKKKEKFEKATEKDSYFDDTSKKQDDRDYTSTREKTANMPKSGEEEGPLLKSQTGGDGESQVEKINGESAKLLPKQRAAPRKYSASKTAKTKTSNKEFLNVTDDDDDEPSRTGSKKPGKKRK